MFYGRVSKIALQHGDRLRRRHTMVANNMTKYCNPVINLPVVPGRRRSTEVPTVQRARTCSREIFGEKSAPVPLAACKVCGKVTKLERRIRNPPFASERRAPHHELHCDGAVPICLARSTRRGRMRHATCCLLYTSPSPRDRQKSRMPSSA